MTKSNEPWLSGQIYLKLFESLLLLAAGNNCANADGDGY